MPYHIQSENSERLFRAKEETNKKLIPSLCESHTHTHKQRRRQDERTDATNVLGLEGLNDGLAIHQPAARSIEEHHALCVRRV